MNIISNGYRFRRGTGSPLDHVANPDVDLGGSITHPVQWCHECSMEVDVDGAAYNQAQVWGKKFWCRRCGTVTSSAVYFHTGSLTTPGTLLLDKAVSWAATNMELTR